MAESGPDDVTAASRGIEADILDIHLVGKLLRYFEDTVRRIPRRALPVYRVGKNNLYLRKDVLAFVCSRRVPSANAFQSVCIDRVPFIGIAQEPMQRPFL